MDFRGTSSTAAGRPSAPRRAAWILALALTLAACLLAGPAQARSSAPVRSAARPAHGAAVHSSCRRVAHPRRGARACAQPRRRVRKGKAVKHAASAPGLPGSPAAPSARSAPACEGGASAVRRGDGSFACADGSEPGCGEGLAPVPAPGGSVLYCSAPPVGGSGGCEAASCTSGEASGALCEDGSAPARGSAGAFSCEDGSEPACFDGATPTRSASGTALVCPPPPAGEEGS